MSLIINIRGTGGSGKSTVVRRAMDCYANKTQEVRKGRKQPFGYILSPGVPGRRVVIGDSAQLFVPGHYETPCGGCDTLKTVDEVFDLVRSHEKVMNVLFEGIMVGDDVRRTVELAQAGHRVVVIGLTTPVEDCLASIRARREASGRAGGRTSETPSKMSGLSGWAHTEWKTAHRARQIERSLARLAAGGCEVERLDREGAYARVLELLGGA